MTIEERIENIEKENQAMKDQARNLRKLAWGAVAIALAAFVGGTAVWVGAQAAYTAAISPASITTQAITLKDSYGRQRLYLYGQTGAIIVYDENGRQRVGLGSSGIVTVYDSNQIRRVRLNAADNKIYFYSATGAGVAAHP